MYLDEENNNFIAALTAQDRDVWAQVSILILMSYVVTLDKFISKERSCYKIQSTQKLYMP